MTLRSMVRGAAERVMCALPRRTRPGDRLILAYHNVVPADWAPRGDRSLHLPIDKFEQQLKLIRNEAEIVPLMELLATDAPNDRRVAITFDDAYASALMLGVGACVAAEAPCTVFVAPALLGTVPYWDRAADAGAWSDADRERFLWEQAGRADESLPLAGVNPTLWIATEDQLNVGAAMRGVTLGNHTMSHPNLAALTTEGVRRELIDAQGWLTAFRRESTIPVVAYPYGLVPRDLAGATWPIHSVYGLLVTGKWQSWGATIDPLAFPRWNVPAGISAAGFRLRLSGVLET